MSLFIIAEHDHQHLDPTFPHLLTAALQLNSEPIVVIASHQCAEVAAEAAVFQGVKQVIGLQNPAFEHLLAEQLAPALHDLITECDYLLMASTTFGKNILPRLAALRNVNQISDVIAIIAPDTFDHPIYAGNAIETVQLLDQQKLLSVRATAFSPQLAKQSVCEIRMVEAKVEKVVTHFVRQQFSPSVRPELTNAKIIVSGGRGLQSAEQFKLVENLADALGAALGASRAAVDAGFISNDHQVGQTGKIVAPSLYIALGISGAIQHLAGIKDAQVIVAINKDENAPIFQVANYGLVGDVFELVPQLIEGLKQRGLYKC